MGINKSFWKGKKTLITGHTGFKGSWLSLWLKQLGSDLIGISNGFPSEPNLFNKLDLGSGMVSLKEDITDYKKMIGIFDTHKPEIVFHLAAQPIVRYSYKHPVETYMTNVMGTLHILEAIRLCKSVRSVVIVTTDKCYENDNRSIGYSEEDPMGGYDPYSSSKGSAELLISSYRRSYFNLDKFSDHKTSLSSVRAGNVIGGGDWAEDRLIPDTVRSIVQNSQIEIRNPSSVRPWQHVLEPLNGYLMLAEKMYSQGEQFSESWNFGPKDEDSRSVKWVVEKILQFWGLDGDYLKVEKEATLHEADYLKLDCSKSISRLGWEPFWTLENSLKKVVEWYKNDIEQASAVSTSISQIEEYMDLS